MLKFTDAKTGKPLYLNKDYSTLVAALPVEGNGCHFRIKSSGGFVEFTVRESPETVHEMFSATADA